MDITELAKIKVLLIEIYTSVLEKLYDINSDETARLERSLASAITSLDTICKKKVLDKYPELK